MVIYHYQVGNLLTLPFACDRLATAAMSHPAVDVVVAAVVVDLEAVPITAPATSVSRRVISLGIAPMSRRGDCEAALSVVELGI